MMSLHAPTKAVPGVYGFVAQLNEGRASKKRPTEFRVDQVHTCSCPSHARPLAGPAHSSCLTM